MNPVQLQHHRARLEIRLEQKHRPRPYQINPFQEPIKSPVRHYPGGLKQFNDDVKKYGSGTVETPELKIISDRIEQYTYFLGTTPKGDESWFCIPYDRAGTFIPCGENDGLESRTFTGLGAKSMKFPEDLRSWKNQMNGTTNVTTHVVTKPHVDNGLNELEPDVNFGDIEETGPVSRPYSIMDGLPQLDLIGRFKAAFTFW